MRELGGLLDCELHKFGRGMTHIRGLEGSLEHRDSVILSRNVIKSFGSTAFL